MSFPVSPVNAQQTTVNGINYIYNSVNNTWTRQTSTSIAVTGTITAGGNLVAAATTTSTSTTTGALVVKGGAGIAGALYISNTGDVSANIGTIRTNLNTLDANVGAFETYANVTNNATQANLGTATTNITTLFSNAGVQATSINTLDANIGTATTNIGTLFSNAGAQGTSINTINANLGAYQTYANTTNSTTQANIGTIRTNLNTLDANVGAFETYANTKIGTNTNSNLVVVATTVSTNTTTGALVVAGGVGIAGNVYTAGWIIPSGNVSQNLGSSTAWWNLVYGKSVQAQYADLAENYVGDLDYAPGTVVVFGGSEEITTTNVSHDTRVAGVVSTNPAYLMNSMNGNVAVAMTGRVPCQVLGPVEKGTVLVSSHISGVAEALNNDIYKPGCVIGKALEQIDSNTIKTIEVVVGRF